MRHQSQASFSNIADKIAPLLLERLREKNRVQKQNEDMQAITQSLNEYEGSPDKDWSPYGMLASSMKEVARNKAKAKLLQLNVPYSVISDIDQQRNEKDALDKTLANMPDAFLKEIEPYLPMIRQKPSLLPTAYNDWSTRTQERDNKSRAVQQLEQARKDPKTDWRSGELLGLAQLAFGQAGANQYLKRAAPEVYGPNETDSPLEYKLSKLAELKREGKLTGQADEYTRMQLDLIGVSPSAYDDMMGIKEGTPEQRWKIYFDAKPKPFSTEDFAFQSWLKYKPGDENAMSAQDKAIFESQKGYYAGFDKKFDKDGEVKKSYVEKKLHDLMGLENLSQLANKAAVTYEEMFRAGSTDGMSAKAKFLHDIEEKRKMGLTTYLNEREIQAVIRYLEDNTE